MEFCTREVVLKQTFCSGHTLMLGWNDKSLAIIQQLALANESEGGGYVVVLSENDKQSMEEILAAVRVSTWFVIF